MAIISKGIKLFKGEEELTNLQEIPNIGGNKEAIEVTVLSDAAHTYIDGLEDYGDSLEFKFIYEKAQFTTLTKLTGTQTWKVVLPDNTNCTFSGTGSVALDGVGTSAALTYTLAIKPSTAMVWGEEA